VIVSSLSISDSEMEFENVRFFFQKGGNMGPNSGGIFKSQTKIRISALNNTIIQCACKNHAECFIKADTKWKNLKQPRSSYGLVVFSYN
jgi:hypothetical protein